MIPRVPTVTALHRSLAATALFAVLLLIAPLQAGGATPTPKKAIWGTPDDPRAHFPIYRDLGVGIYQWPVRWHPIAPTRPASPEDPSDPAYRWPDLDGVIADARASGMEVMMEIQGTPAWANGGRNPAWAPKRPADVAAFMTAISRRYPDVKYWMIWNEPTRTDRFKPMAAQRQNWRLTRKQQRGPRLYARILDASYGALKAVDARDLVIGGNTFTTGTIAPLVFIKYLRLPDGRPPRMDLYGHNPFTARAPDLRRKPVGPGLADFSDLDTLNSWVRRHLKRGGHRPRIYISEFFTPTDHRNREFNFWVSKKTQAKWLKAALRIARRQSYIHTLGVFLYDEVPSSSGDEVNGGLMTHDGKRKPAYRAFRDG
jgi:hypothetical protein